MNPSLHIIKMGAVSVPRVRLENDGHPWVRYGQDNLFPQALMDYRQASPTHQAILQLKADLCLGDGLLNVPEGLETALNDELLRRLSLDWALFQGMALQVIWSRDGSRLAHVSHLPFASLRLAKPQGQESPSEYYYSPNWEAWEKERLASAKPQVIAAFDPERRSTQPRQVLYVADYSPEIPWYPLPSYHSAIPDILFEREYARFRTNSMQRGMFPSLHIHIEGEPLEEDKERFYRDVKKKFSGSDNAGEVLITYGYEGNGKTTLTPLQVQGNSELFAEWATDARQRIIMAHRLSSPLLIGLPGKAGLGNGGNELATAHTHLYETQIRPVQQRILRVLKEVAGLMGQAAPTLEIANSKPLRFVFGEALLEKILTQDELRLEAGYPALNPTLSPSESHESD